MFPELPGYKIDRPLGEGGMGVVYHAINREGSEVAIKVMNQLDYSGTHIERFKREIDIGRKMDHPNITKVFGGRTLLNGTMFMIMEYLEGDDLVKVLKERKLKKREIINIVESVCSALSYGHRRNIIHRDVKPGNIFICKSRRVVLLDYGIAKVIGDIVLTTTGGKVGTSRYMSPEQINGDRIDNRTDIYSFGLVVYEMLAGEKACKGKTELNILKWHTEGKAVEVIRNSYVSSPVKKVLQRALSSNKYGRIRTVENFIETLKEALKPKIEETIRIPVVHLEDNLIKHKQNIELLNNDLHSASVNGDLKIVKRVLVKGVNVNSVDPDGWTPLHKAAFYGKSIIVNELIKYGAELDIKGKNCGTPYDLAFEQKKYKVMRILKKAGAKSNLFSSFIELLKPRLR